jgi:hypothetical protein
VDGLRAVSTAPAAQSADAKVVTELLADPEFGARQVLPSDFDLPREIAANGDTRVVVAISPKATCYGVFSTEGWSNSGCGPTKGVGENVGAGVVKANDGYVAYAILPDDVSSATVVSSDGSKRGLTSRYNAALVQVDSPPDHLEVQTASGSKSVPFGKLR